MKLRVAKKIVKNEGKLKYGKHQVDKAKNVVKKFSGEKK